MADEDIYISEEASHYVVALRKGLSAKRPLKRLKAIVECLGASQEKLRAISAIGYVDADGVLVDFDALRNPCLHLARDRPAVELLLTLGADPYAINGIGHTPDEAMANRGAERAAIALIRKRQLMETEFSLQMAISPTLGHEALSQMGCSRLVM